MKDIQVSNEQALAIYKMVKRQMKANPNTYMIHLCNMIIRCAKNIGLFTIPGPVTGDEFIRVNFPEFMRMKPKDVKESTDLEPPWFCADKKGYQKRLKIVRKCIKLRQDRIRRVNKRKNKA